MRRIGEALAVAVIALVVVLALSGPGLERSPVADAVIARGERDTGAVNLVSSIYLGYRAFDTLGETIVLLVAVSGVVVLIKGAG